jgi:HAD superfamily hydrolase (TIGR01509 family)
VTACFEAFLRDYEDEGLNETFPSLAEHVRRFSGLPREMHGLLGKTIAQHEVGRVPGWAAAFLRDMARRRPIGIVSNVWSPAWHWRAELARSGVADVVSVAVFSSDLGAVKPSAKPFLHALTALGLPAERVVFVGDSLARDMAPAKALGMRTVWVGTGDDHGLALHQLSRLDAWGW